MLQVSRWVAGFCLVVVCLGLCACAPQREPQPNVWPAKAQVHWLDSGMRDVLDIVAVDVRANASGIATLSIQGQNLDAQTRFLAYRVDWFSASGRKIRGGTSQLWKHKEVLGKDMLYIRDVAPNANAVRAQIVIREADRGSATSPQHNKDR